MPRADTCLLASLLVVVAIVAKMLRAIRLLDGRVTLLQEQLHHSRNTLQNPARKPIQFKAPSGKTPIEGVPVLASSTPAPRLVNRTPPPEEPSRELRYPGEATAHVIDQEEVDAVWAQLAAEQERLKQAMGRDFQVRERKRSASEIRGRPVVARTLSAQEVAKKLERK